MSSLNPKQQPGAAFHRTRVKFAWVSKNALSRVPSSPHSILRSVEFQGGQICDSSASLIAATGGHLRPQLNDTSDNIGHLLATFTSVHSGLLRPLLHVRTGALEFLLSASFPLPPPWHTNPNWDG